MTTTLAERGAEKRREGQALIREADKVACQSWNERMWSDGGRIELLAIAGAGDYADPDVPHCGEVTIKALGRFDLAKNAMTCMVKASFEKAR